MSTDSASQPAPVAAVIVLAAGESKRMKSDRSKTLHTIAGQSLLELSVTAAAELEPRQLVVVVGHDKEQVSARLSELAPGAQAVVQPAQRGTGDAVRCGFQALADADGEVVVTYADVPLLEGRTLVDLVATHRADGNDITVLTARPPDPSGYGRILRSGDRVVGIVEHRDASSEQLAINEINSGIYVFAADVLRTELASLGADNEAGELYLTDVVAAVCARGGRVGGFCIVDAWQAAGVNDRAQLAAVGAEYNRRITHRWMLNGVTIVDPQTTWIDADVDLGSDVTIWPGTQLYGATSVEPGATIGPDVTLRDCEVGANACVVRSHCELAVIGPDAQVGPYARLRPGTQLGADGLIGTFVETKNAVLGRAARLGHLTYLGDAEIGAGSDVGAGVVFANWDATNRARTTLGEATFVGAGSLLVPPVDVEANTVVQPGSRIFGASESADGDAESR